MLDIQARALRKRDSLVAALAVIARLKDHDDRRTVDVDAVGAGEDAMPA